MEFDGITLVTGAAGFLGRHLAQALAKRGVPLRAAVRAKEDDRFLRALGAEVVRADLREPKTLPPLFEGGVDRVFHLAAICNLSTPYAVLYPANVVGVERITELAARSSVKRYVHMSVYGPHRGRPFLEDSERTPRDDYGRSKFEGEEIVWKKIAKGLPAIIARPCTVYGPGCTDGAGKVFSRATSILISPSSMLPRARPSTSRMTVIRSSKRRWLSRRRPSELDRPGSIFRSAWSRPWRSSRAPSHGCGVGFPTSRRMRCDSSAMTTSWTIPN
jgi:UDP-glucose 4-epimerase